MNTILTFKATKATEGKDIQYQVDLGQDILDGLSEETIKGHARANAKVEIQNRKGSLLRQSPNIEGALSAIKDFGYPDATVEVYVPTPKTPRKVLTVDDMITLVRAGKLDKQALRARLDELE